MDYISPDNRRLILESVSSILLKNFDRNEFCGIYDYDWNLLRTINSAEEIDTGEKNNKVYCVIEHLSGNHCMWHTRCWEAFDHLIKLAYGSSLNICDVLCALSEN